MILRGHSLLAAAHRHRPSLAHAVMGTLCRHASTADIADTANAAASSHRGDGALFMQNFARRCPVALDTFAFGPTSKPTTKVGEALGLRAVFRYLTERPPLPRNPPIPFRLERRLRP